MVNNVGMGFSMDLDYYHKYAECDAPFSDLINCNIKSVTQMTAIVLPNMVKKRKGIVINIGSMAGRLPFPILTTYSASKRYVDFFSRYSVYFILITYIFKISQ